MPFPRGSFYAFPSVQGLGLNEIDFCHRLLREQEVAVVPELHLVNMGKDMFELVFDILRKTG